MRSKHAAYGYRYQQRASEKAKRKARLVRISLVVAVLLILAFVIKSFTGGGSPVIVKKPVKQVVNNAAKNISAKDTKKPIRKTQKTLIGVYVGGKMGDRNSLYHAIVIIEDNSAKIISLPGDLITNVTSDKYEKLQTAVEIGGAQAFLNSLDTLGLRNIKHFMYLPESFGDLSPGNLSEAFLKARDSSLSAEKRVKLSRQLKNASALKIYYPVKEVRAGTDRYSQPLESELGEINKLLGIEKINTDRLRVLILNGNGEPGIGGKVALRLLKKGFLIDDIRNLKDREGKDNFNQAETVAYGDIKYDSEILRMLTVIGIGKKIQSKPLTGTQITLVIGKDYK